MKTNKRKLPILLISILTLVSLFLISCGQEVEKQSVANDPAVDSVVSADGVMIQYDVAGEGEPTLVFVHGWSCDRSYWKVQIEEFAKTYQVVAVDMGGHGESGLGREDWTQEAFGADVASVINKINPNNVVLIGHSMGGGVCLEAARQLSGRVIGLIGVDTYKKFGTGYSPEQITEIVTPFRADFAGSVNGFMRGRFSENADSTLVNRIIADMSAAPQEVAISAMVDYFGTNTQEMLKEVRVPIRVINSDIGATDLETNRKHAASFEMKLITGVGHFIPQEDPTAFNRTLHEILDELAGTSGTPVKEE